MSFYGNVTNTARTHFQFDRIYASRKEMDVHKEEDGIYAGRYVLVEYDNQMHMDTFLRVSKIVNENGKEVFYAMLGDPAPTESRLTCGIIHPETIVYTSSYEEDLAGGHFVKNCVFYRCKSEYAEGSTAIAEFEEIADDQARFIYLGSIDRCLFQPETYYTRVNNDYQLASTWSENALYYIKNNYFTNYTLDKKCYGRGYDSTVWQKVYVGGKEKYIMIAELNSIVPVFDIEADAPTQAPIAPHFDLESTDLYYKLHYQPSWGLRVKSARQERGSSIDKQGNIVVDAEGEEIIVDYSTQPNDYKTDEITTWSRNIYNPNTGEVSTVYWNPTEVNADGSTGSWQDTPPSGMNIPAEIYYNKAGFSVTENIIDNTSDCISLEPTGKSGQQYNVHNGSTNAFEATPDIQELSIILPSIGNSIAKMWNIVYGEGELNNGVKRRNLDIDWDSTEGLRMVNVDPSGHGFTYSPEKTSTLAGAINSVHDLMGMIIEVPENIDDIEDYAPAADKDTIYYFNNKYYRQGIKYTYDENNIISGTTLTPEQLQELVYSPVTRTFADFPEGLYYGISGINYTLETNPYPTKGRIYFTQDPADRSEDFFTEARFELYDTSRHYLRTQQVDKNQNSYYSYSNLESSPHIGGKYYIFEVEMDADGNRMPIEGRRPYINNKYFIYTDAEGNAGVEIDREDPNVLAKISLAQIYNADYKYYTVMPDEDDDKEIKIVPVELFEVTENHCYYRTNTSEYIQCGDKIIPGLNTLQELDNLQFYNIINIEEITNLYFPNTLYTKNDDKYIICTKPANDLNLDLVYYKKANELIVDLTPYYVNNTYYYQLDNLKYILDSAYEATEGRQYFTKETTLYVYEDRKNVFGTGSEWNILVTDIPDTVSLTTRIEEPTMIELEGFARELNTIHGLILKINNLLLINDDHTRDTSTIQGSINALNDIINKFEVIAPRQLMIVDDYGRVHSSPYDTDEWINLEINGDVLTPKVTITHEFNPVANETESVSQNVDNSSGDINLYTPLLDNCGHVVGNKITTVELPHGFKTLSHGDETIIASNHIETLKLTDDDWVKMTLTNSTKTAAFTHGDPQAVSNTVSMGSATTFKFGDTIQIPSVSYDSKGHIASTATLGATLPLLTVTTDTQVNADYNNQVLTRASQDGTELKGRPIVEITLGGYEGNTTHFNASDTIGSALDKISLSLNGLKSQTDTLSSINQSITTIQADITAIKKKVGIT